MHPIRLSTPTPSNQIMQVGIVSAWQGSINFISRPAAITLGELMSSSSMVRFDLSATQSRWQTGRLLVRAAAMKWEDKSMIDLQQRYVLFLSSRDHSWIRRGGGNG